MSKRLTLNDAQSKLEVKYPDSSVEILEFNGVNHPCTVKHPVFGCAQFSQFTVLINFENTLALHQAIQRKNLASSPPPTQPTPPTAADIIKLLGKLEVIEDLYHREHLSPSEFKSRVGKVLRS